MVDLRECLWRVPVALTYMVDIEERSRASQERCCKVNIILILSCLSYYYRKIIVQVTNAGVTLPSAFTRERNNVKRKGIFRPRSMVIDDDIPMSPVSPQGYFTQQHTDAKTFMEEHFMVSHAIGKGLLVPIISSRKVKTSPFPSCHQIARKDNLWHSYKRMQQKYGRQHFDFLSDSFTIPEQREMLKEAMEREPGSYWIVKPPGKIT